MHKDYYRSQPQSMLFPQMQSIPLPVFQGPATMGYYHQAPVSWSAAPANGLMPSLILTIMYTQFLLHTV
uniref:Uncharacterized protein n=1 Tax=Brassica oleracea TaxID=3712 RepID=A0A3P6B040_BRAOL|nr:unnamed protein product [Brassica oleracea]